MGNRTCSIEGCGKPVKARGWCGAHHQNWRRTGTPYGISAVPVVGLPGERWLPIVGWESLYQVSDLGRVYSVRKGRFIGWTTGNGYRLATLCDGEGNDEQQYIHVLVAEAFIGPKPPGEEVRHLDGTRTNNVWTNLAWGTRSENMRDKERHGTSWQLNKTRCPQDHPYDEENTYWHPKGGRICRTCSREAKRRYKERQKRKAA